MGRIADIKEMVKFQNLSLLKKKKKEAAYLGISMKKQLTEYKWE